MLNLKNNLIVVFCLAISTILLGCATSAQPISQASAVPADRLFYSSTTVPAGHARAVFVRDTGFTGMGVHHHLYINGKKAASFAQGEKAEFLLAPGEYVFGVVPTDAFGTHSLNSIDQDIKADRKYFYRIQTDGNSFRTVVQRFMPND